MPLSPLDSLARPWTVQGNSGANVNDTGRAFFNPNPRELRSPNNMSGVEFPQQNTSGESGGGMFGGTATLPGQQSFAGSFEGDFGQNTGTFGGGFPNTNTNNTQATNPTQTNNGLNSFKVPQVTPNFGPQDSYSDQIPAWLQNKANQGNAISLNPFYAQVRGFSDSLDEIWIPGVGMVPLEQAEQILAQQGPGYLHTNQIFRNIQIQKQQKAAYLAAQEEAKKKAILEEEANRANDTAFQNGPPGSEAYDTAGEQIALQRLAEEKQRSSPWNDPNAVTPWNFNQMPELFKTTDRLKSIRDIWNAKPDWAQYSNRIFANSGNGVDTPAYQELKAGLVGGNNNQNQETPDPQAALKTLIQMLSGNGNNPLQVIINALMRGA